MERERKVEQQISTSYTSLDPLELLSDCLVNTLKDSHAHVSFRKVSFAFPPTPFICQPSSRPHLPLKLTCKRSL